MQEVTPVTSIPTTAPASTSGVYRSPASDSLEFAVRVSTGTGTARLLFYDFGLAKWIPYGTDGAGAGVLALDSSANGGWAHGVARTPIGGGRYWLIWVLGGPAVDKAGIGGETVP